MCPTSLSRRITLLGAISTLGGCGAVAALETASVPLDTYDLSPAKGNPTGRRSAGTLVVARPDAPAAIATDRIMVKPDAVSITYLPEARWSDELPLVLQSLLVRSISATGRIGYVGRSEGGPVPTAALLVRMDAFHVEVRADGVPVVTVDIALTLLNDNDQRVIATRSFAGTAPAPDDSPAAIVVTFQAMLDRLLSAMADWTLQNL